MSTDDSIPVEIDVCRFLDLGRDSGTTDAAIFIQVKANLVLQFVHQIIYGEERNVLLVFPIDGIETYSCFLVRRRYVSMRAVCFGNELPSVLYSSSKQNEKKGEEVSLTSLRDAR